MRGGGGVGRKEGDGLWRKGGEEGGGVSQEWVNYWKGEGS